MVSVAMDLSAVQRLIESLGMTGLVVVVVWKLVDRWAGRFLAVQDKQASAMGELASAVRDNQDEQREVVMAVRVLAGKVDETKGWVKELGEFIREGRCAEALGKKGCLE